MRIAVVHEWLVDWAGSERVLAEILTCFPEADLYCLVDSLSPENRRRIGGRHANVSFIRRLPFSGRKPWWYLPLLPIAIEQFDLSGYDLVISSSHAVAKGVLTGPDQVHISYVHSPMRYAWDLQHVYLKEANLAHGVRGALARMLLHYMRLWDTRTSNGVDTFVANSKFIARRIKKVYGRTAEVIYPPVDIDQFTPGRTKEDFYLTASRFVPYKKMPMIVAAFSRMPDKRLIVIGTGPEEATVRAAARPNVTLLGYQPRAALIDHMQRARAFVFAAEEDFGIVPVEAQACGTPVIAFGKGGAVESVIDGQTGVLFPEQTAESLIDVVARFEKIAATFDPKIIRRNAERFDASIFRRDFTALVEREMRK
jgi:glycosyltransferase involved in cell wall biosynthesis